MNMNLSMYLYKARPTHAMHHLQQNIGTWPPPCQAAYLCLQRPLLGDLSIALHLIPDLEVRPILEAHTALATLTHDIHVFLDVLERGEIAYENTIRLATPSS